jgi:hypothetical protein
MVRPERLHLLPDSWYVIHPKRPLFMLVIDIVTQATLSSTRSRILMPWQRNGYQSEFSPPSTFPSLITSTCTTLLSFLSPPGPFSSHSTNLFLSHSDANEKGEHTTEDFAQGSKPIFDARRLKVLVDNDPDRKDVPAPRLNAESYAGAATELWAQKFCKKDFIPPKNGYQT